MAKQKRTPTTRKPSADVFTLEVFLTDGPISPAFAKKNPIVARTIEIRADGTLADLHQAIFEAFDRDDEHLYEFQFGGKGPYDPKARRYGLTEYEDDLMGGESAAGDVRETTIGSLKLKVGGMFGYWFDFGDDWRHQVRVLSIAPAETKVRYPRISSRQGKSPPQYP
jgi:hypothetical protein